MFLDVRAKLIEHYAQMALNQGSIGQARLRVTELESCSSQLWSGIGQQVKQRIEELKNETSRKG